MPRKEDQGEEDTLFMQAADEGFIVVTPPEALYEVKEKLEREGITVQEASLEIIPKNTVECDPETRVYNEALIEFLEGLDDVDAVFHNMS